jgi:hypothetical protein
MRCFPVGVSYFPLAHPYGSLLAKALVYGTVRSRLRLRCSPQEGRIPLPGRPSSMSANSRLHRLQTAARQEACSPT